MRSLSLVMRGISWSKWEKRYPGCSAAWDVSYPQGRPVVSIKQIRTCGWNNEEDDIDHLYLYDGEDVHSYHERFQFWCKTWLIPVDSCWYCVTDNQDKTVNHIHNTMRLAGVGWAANTGLIK